MQTAIHQVKNAYKLHKNVEVTESIFITKEFLQKKCLDLRKTVLIQAKQLVVLVFFNEKAHRRRHIHTCIYSDYTDY